MSSPVVAGVDVGADAKGFHVCVVAGRELLFLEQLEDPQDVVTRLREFCVVLAAVDSPKTFAPDGEQSREGERRLAVNVCNIRFTPDEATVRQREDRFYGWVLNGRRLYDALERGGIKSIECFPTASFSRLHGKRDGANRSRWTSDAVAGFDLIGLQHRMNQDDRDAVCAARTAGLHRAKRTEAFGDIVVPLTP